MPYRRAVFAGPFLVEPTAVSSSIFLDLLFSPLGILLPKGRSLYLGLEYKPGSDHRRYETQCTLALFNYIVHIRNQGEYLPRLYPLKP